MERVTELEAATVIFDMANNHMGDVQHGKKIIDMLRRARSATSDHLGLLYAVKFQFRDIAGEFIHSSADPDIPYVKRFKETALTPAECKELVHYAEDNGFVTVCTPFDEASVDLINDIGIDIVKVASCSFTDWPLLNKIAESTIHPIIASTAGAEEEDIENVHDFLRNRGREFALMHCVGEYPTVPENLQLNHIARLKGKFPGVLIGFSTHEEPENTGAVAMAYALGAAIFERHVGVATDEYKLNAYSSDYDEVVAWIRSLKAAFDMLGYGPRCSSDKEDADLHRFKRGVYLRRNVAKGSPVTRDDVGFAFPNVDGQLVANDMSKYNAFVAKKNLTAGSPLLREDTSVRYIRNLIQGHVQELVAMVKDSNIIIGDDVPLEISHHYGIDNFEEYGLSMLTIMNTGDYCKKYLISLPGQKHPTQWHEEKKETFIVLYGTVCVNLGVGDVWYDIGDVIHIEPRMTHKFVGGPEGCIIEEISTTHHVNDSFYTDPDVAKNLNRKTFVDYWRNVK